MTWNPAYHPRDKRGRFTRSSTRAMSQTDRNRGRKAMTGFAPVRHTDAGAARDYLEGFDTPATPAVKTYLDGGWRDTNTALRAGKTPDGVDELDEAMRTLPEDVMLRRQVPLSLFGNVPVKDLEGRKVRDAAPASTSLDVPGQDAGGAGVVTMHIAAPKGTPALVNAADGEILLARDTEVAVTRVEPDGDGGWDVYGAVLPTVGVKSAKSGVKSGGKSGEKPTDPDPGRPEGGDQVRADLMKLKVPELRAQMLERGLKPGKLRKSQMVDALIADETGDEPASGTAATEAPPNGTVEGRQALASAPAGLHRDNNDLTGAKFDGLTEYQDGYQPGFRGINAGLRDGNPSSNAQAAIDGIDAAMADSALTSDVAVYRGVRDARVMFGDRLDGDLTGLLWREDAYVSTSVDETAVRGFTRGTDGVVMRIVAPAGTGAVDLPDPADPSEEELLLDRGHTFKVTADRGGVDGVREIDVVVLPNRSVRVAGQDRVEELAVDSAAMYTDASRGNSPGWDRKLGAIVARQGFDARPLTGTSADVDAAVGNSWIETWRGVQAGRSGTAAEINERLRRGPFEPGTGIYGNGVYTSVRRDTAEAFRGVDVRRRTPDSGLEPDSMLRIAIDPTAKIIDYGDLQKEFKAYLRSLPNRGKLAPDERLWLPKERRTGEVFLLGTDIGRYAAARGYDAIRIPNNGGKWADGAYNYRKGEERADQYNVLNRSVMLIQEADSP